MFKVELLEFKPFEDDQEVVFKIRKPDFASVLKANSLLSEISMQDPQEKESDKMIKMMPYFNALVEQCVKEVKGVEIEGVQMKTGADLILYQAPREIMEPLYLFLMKQLSAPQELKKKL